MREEEIFVDSRDVTSDDSGHAAMFCLSRVRERRSCFPNHSDELKERLGDLSLTILFKVT